MSSLLAFNYERLLKFLPFSEDHLQGRIFLKRINHCLLVFFPIFIFFKTMHSQNDQTGALETQNNNFFCCLIMVGRPFQNSFKKFYPWILHFSGGISRVSFFKKVINLVSTIIMYSQNLWEEIRMCMCKNCMCKLDNLFKLIVTNTFISFGESGQLVLLRYNALFEHVRRYPWILK